MRRELRKALPYLSLIGLFFAFQLVDTLSVWKIYSISLGGWAWIVMKAFRFALMMTAVGLLVPRVAKLIYVSLFIFFSIVASAVVFLRVNFNMRLGGDWLCILMTSSQGEVSEFLASYGILWICIGVVAFCSVIVLGVFFLIRVQLGRFRIRKFILGLLCLVPFGFWDVGLGGWISAVNGTIYFKLVKDTWQSHRMGRELIDACRCPQLSSRAALRTAGEEAPIFVLVIGESATRNNWSLYGYERDTTPCCEGRRGEMAVFNDVIAAFPRTVGALRYILTRATLDGNPVRCSLPAVLKSVGYSTILLSGQRRWDRNMSQNNGLQQIVFGSCEKTIYLDEIVDGATYYDDQLVPLLKEEIKISHDRPLAIFVNLMGSHFDFGKRFPPEFAEFSRGDGILPNGGKGTLNQYDDSIKFTDWVLGQMMDILSVELRPVVFVYLSDHGETPRTNKSWRVMTDLDCWEIPLFVWWNRAFQSFYPDVVKRVGDSVNRRLQSDQLFDGLLELAHVETGEADEAENFLSGKFEERSVRMLQLDAVDREDAIPYEPDAHNAAHK